MKSRSKKKSWRLAPLLFSRLIVQGVLPARAQITGSAVTQTGGLCLNRRPPCNRRQLLENDLRSCDVTRLQKCQSDNPMNLVLIPPARNSLCGNDRLEPFEDFSQQRRYLVQFTGPSLGTLINGSRQVHAEVNPEDLACFGDAERGHSCPEVCYQVEMFAGECWGSEEVPLPPKPNPDIGVFGLEYLMHHAERTAANAGNSAFSQQQWDLAVPDTITSDNGCMGRCGAGCLEEEVSEVSCSNWGRDCLRYDVCSYIYDGVLYRDDPLADPNCGDEYAMTVDDLRSGCDPYAADVVSNSSSTFGSTSSMMLDLYSRDYCGLRPQRAANVCWQKQRAVCSACGGAPTEAMESDVGEDDEDRVVAGNSVDGGVSVTSTAAPSAGAVSLLAQPATAPANPGTTTSTAGNPFVCYYQDPVTSLAYPTLAALDQAVAQRTESAAINLGVVDEAASTDEAESTATTKFKDAAAASAETSGDDATAGDAFASPVLAMLKNEVLKNTTSGTSSEDETPGQEPPIKTRCTQDDGHDRLTGALSLRIENLESSALLQDKAEFCRRVSAAIALALQQFLPDIDQEGPDELNVTATSSVDASDQSLNVPTALQRLKLPNIFVDFCSYSIARTDRFPGDLFIDHGQNGVVNGIQKAFPATLGHAIGSERTEVKLAVDENHLKNGDRLAVNVAAAKTPAYALDVSPGSDGLPGEGKLKVSVTTPTSTSDEEAGGVGEAGAAAAAGAPTFLRQKLDSTSSSKSSAGAKTDSSAGSARVGNVYCRNPALELLGMRMSAASDRGGGASSAHEGYGWPAEHELHYQSHAQVSATASQSPLETAATAAEPAFSPLKLNVTTDTAAGTVAPSLPATAPPLAPQTPLALLDVSAPLDEYSLDASSLPGPFSYLAQENEEGDLKTSLPSSVAGRAGLPARMASTGMEWYDNTLSILSPFAADPVSDFAALTLPSSSSAMYGSTMSGGQGSGDLNRNRRETDAAITPHAVRRALADTGEAANTGRTVDMDLCYRITSAGPPGANANSSSAPLDDRVPPPSLVDSEYRIFKLALDAEMFTHCINEHIENAVMATVSPSPMLNTKSGHVGPYLARMFRAGSSARIRGVHVYRHRHQAVFPGNPYVGPQPLRMSRLRHGDGAETALAVLADLNSRIRVSHNLREFFDAGGRFLEPKEEQAWFWNAVLPGSVAPPGRSPLPWHPLLAAWRAGSSTALPGSTSGTFLPGSNTTGDGTPSASSVSLFREMLDAVAGRPSEDVEDVKRALLTAEQSQFGQVQKPSLGRETTTEGRETTMGIASDEVPQASSLLELYQPQPAGSAASSEPSFRFRVTTSNTFPDVSNAGLLLATGATQNLYYCPEKPFGSRFENSNLRFLLTQCQAMDSEFPTPSSRLCTGVIANRETTYGYLCLQPLQQCGEYELGTGTPHRDCEGGLGGAYVIPRLPGIVQPRQLTVEELEAFAEVGTSLANTTDAGVGVLATGSTSSSSIFPARGGDGNELPDAVVAETLTQDHMPAFKSGAELAHAVDLVKSGVVERLMPTVEASLKETLSAEFLNNANKSVSANSSQSLDEGLTSLTPWQKFVEGMATAYAAMVNESGNEDNGVNNATATGSNVMLGPSATSARELLNSLQADTGGGEPLKDTRAARNFVARVESWAGQSFSEVLNQELHAKQDTFYCEDDDLSIKRRSQDPMELLQECFLRAYKDPVTGRLTIDNNAGLGSSLTGGLLGSSAPSSAPASSGSAADSGSASFLQRSTRKKKSSEDRSCRGLFVNSDFTLAYECRRKRACASVVTPPRTCGAGWCVKNTDPNRPVLQPITILKGPEDKSFGTQFTVKGSPIGQFAFKLTSR